MRLLDVAWLYLLVGLACGLAVVVRRGRRDAQTLATAALTALIWPLWAPFALDDPRLGASRGARGAGTSVLPDPRITDAAQRIDAALREAVESAREGALASVLPGAAAERILAEVARVAGRHAALASILRTPEHDPVRAEARVGELEARGDNPRAVATARLHAENVQRLARLRDRDLRALEELAELTAALRTQLLLARFAGTAVEGASDIVGEVWARVEGLGEALDATGTTDRHT